MLGMCPTLAVTTTAINGIGMGLSTTAVVVLSKIIFSALRKIIPDRLLIHEYFVIVVYIPRSLVNCIIVGRAEAYAAKNGPLESAFDGSGMGLGFTVGLTCIAIVRELIGSGAFFGMEIIPEDFHVTIIGLAPGAFFVLACLTALQNKSKAPSATNGSVPQSTLACGGNCASCSGSACSSNHSVLEEKKAEELKKAEEAKKAAAAAALAKKQAAEAAKAAAEAEKKDE